MKGRYTLAQWRTERSALNRGDAPARCPDCGRTGFYAPREDHVERRRNPYRFCSFCGFWQEAGELPNRATKYECHGHEAMRGPGSSWTCPTCQRSKAPAAGEPWPSADPSHRWWQVPQGLSQREYLTYWRLEWGYDARPHGIV